MVSSDFQSNRPYDQQGRYINDCPNCRKRGRKWVSVGPIDFCSRSCAVEYVYKMEGWISNQEHKLQALKEAISDKP